ncbi:hypothetical protein J8273_5098 [Carpediemonas membranifera]|uniref:Uncharacterized protein n=1 Tax=Carpediemonas membranifera TaxID=201153 RepID=A0A8J6B188_9EUKA|nr:hypothetical protein J8273_5098 [Carpediemonas membranifera]|eukprot:KAG9392119.1 hypothetical protein J8273_5098 [Carpediemonas membranifera]
MESLREPYEVSPALLKILLKLTRENIIEQLRFMWTFPPTHTDQLLYEIYLEFVADCVVFARKNQFNILETLASLQLLISYVASSPVKNCSRGAIASALACDKHFTLLRDACKHKLISLIEVQIEPLKALYHSYACFDQYEAKRTVTVTIQLPAGALPLKDAMSPAAYIKKIDDRRAAEKEAKEAAERAEVERKLLEEQRKAAEEAEAARLAKEKEEEERRLQAEREAEAERIRLEEEVVQARLAEERRLRKEKEKELPPEVMTEVQRQAALFREKLAKSVEAGVLGGSG